MIILPLSVGASSVLITLLQEVLIIGLGIVVTTHLYDVILKNHAKHGGILTISKKRSAVDYLPMNSDLPYQHGATFGKLLVTITRLLIFSITIFIGFSLDTVEVHEPNGFADRRMKVVTSFQERQIDHNYDYLATVKETCEVVEGDKVYYSAALYRTTDGAISCGEGWQGKRTEIVIVRWQNVVVPSDASPKVVAFHAQGKLRHDSERICEYRELCRHWMEFFEKDGKIYLHKTGPGFNHSYNGTMEIVKPRQFFILHAHQVVGDIHHGVTTPLALARSFSNHIMWEEKVNVELPSKPAVFRGALRLYGFVLGIVTICVIVVGELILNYARKRLPFPHLSFTSHMFSAASCTARYLDGARSEKYHDIMVMLSEHRGESPLRVCVSVDRPKIEHSDGEFQYDSDSDERT